MKTEDILLSVFTAFESVHGFSAFEPSVFTIRTMAVPAGQQAQIRAGYIPSVLLSLGIGAVVSYVIRNPAPIIAAGGASVAMISVYEWALRAPITSVKYSAPRR